MINSIHFSFSQDKVGSLNDSINKHLYNNPNKAKLFCHKLLAISKSDNLYETKVFTYCYLSDLCSVLGQKDSVFYYFDKGIQEALQNKDQNLEMIVKVNKAKYLFNQFDFDGALTLYNECLELSEKQNDKYVYNYILLKKAGISYELERYNDALKIYRESLTKTDFNDAGLLDIKLGLVKTYIKLKNPDSAYIFIKKSIDEAQKSDLKEHEILFLEQLGMYYIDKKDFTKAQSTFEKALKIAQNTQNKNVIIPIKVDFSKLFSIKKEFSNAIAILQPIVEVSEDGIPAEFLSEIYYLLAENYKSVGDLSKSSYYFELFIEKSKKIGQKRIETIDHLHKIDISEIKEREADEAQQKWILVALSSLLLIVIFGLYIRRRVHNRKNQVKFEDLLLKIKNFEEQSVKTTLESQSIHLNLLESKSEIVNLSLEEEISESEPIIESIIMLDEPLIEGSSTEDVEEEDIEEEIANTNFVIKDETKTEILDKLIKLEEKKYFLKQDFTLHNVAKRLKTNTAYLSKIVNNELDKNFSTYVNELRINYIIIELKNNSKLRSYSINAIAEEIGYKSPESFTKYFKVATGISPSVYIKKINKMNEVQ